MHTCVPIWLFQQSKLFDSLTPFTFCPLFYLLLCTNEKERGVCICIFNMDVNDIVLVTLNMNKVNIWWYISILYLIIISWGVYISLEAITSVRDIFSRAVVKSEGFIPLTNGECYGDRCGTFSCRFPVRREGARESEVSSIHRAKFSLKKCIPLSI